MRWNVMVIVSRCWDGVRREDGAPVTWPGIVCCVYARLTRRTGPLLCLSYLLHTSDTQLTLLIHTRGMAAWVSVCVSREFLHQSHTRAACSQPSQAAHILLCPASSDAIYAFLDQAQPSLTRHSPVASSEAKQQNTSVFGKYTR